MNLKIFFIMLSPPENQRTTNVWQDTVIVPGLLDFVAIDLVIDVALFVVLCCCCYLKL